MNTLNNIVKFVNSHYFYLALVALYIVAFDEFPPTK